MQQQFRDAMAHLASAVSIVTSQGKAGKIGITVSSVTSVTDSPATLLFCVNRQSEMHDVLLENGCVCINVLAHAQEELAKHFAGMQGSSMAERFSWPIWEEEIKLKDAVARLSGNISATTVVGTHTVFFVELTDIHVAPKDALTYFGRRFHGLACPR